MPRRRIATLTAVALLATACSSAGSDDAEPLGADPSTERSADQPNFVIVLLDDLDELVTPYWDALPKTRRLLAERGRTFSHAFAPTPTCCPARANTLTGRYSHNTGVVDNSAPDGGFRTFAGQAENDTVATRLQDAGYRTGFFGKYLNGYPDGEPEYVAPGWDEWFAFTAGFYDGYSYDVNHDGSIESYGEEPVDYQTDVLARQARDFVADVADDPRPFFLVVAPTAPHYPLPPARRHVDHPWTDAVAPRLPNFDEADVSDKSTWLREGVPRLDYGRLIFNDEDHRNRMGSLLAIDDMVAGLFEELEHRGERARTYVVLVSDNGVELGSHRLIGKATPYETSLRVPLVIAGPRVRAGVEDRFVLQIDLAPTILELATGDTVDSMDGASILPLLEDRAEHWRTDFLAEFDNTEFRSSLQTLSEVEVFIATGRITPAPTFRALRTEDYLFVRWYRTPPHEYELYDMAADPYQEQNLLATAAGAREWADVTDELEARLDELASCAAASCR
jgi:arylsulfatase A-like enzyme